MSEDSVLYGTETKKALQNFRFSDLTMPRHFIWALGHVKAACAQANGELGLLDIHVAELIATAAKSVAEGKHDEAFPVDVFQTGSGTSTNMNANEVIAALVAKMSEGKVRVHPNDDVNMGQSSNDVIPSCIHVSAKFLLDKQLLPALEQLERALTNKADDSADIVKTGRTHLMDAMPIGASQELGGWCAQIAFGRRHLTNSLDDLGQLALGGTAVGTGVNSHPEMAVKAAIILSDETGLNFSPSRNFFRSISSQDTAINLSGQLKQTAISLIKIADDIRWYSSGPLTGINEITLPELQKGSSIMPGKVNPVLPEAILMACTKVMGNDTTLSMAGRAGNFQLNTMLPLIAYTLTESIQLVVSSANALKEVINSMTYNRPVLTRHIEQNPILVTALAPIIGYDKSVEIAKKAYAENRSVIDVAKELTDLSEQQLSAYLAPAAMLSPQAK